MSPRKVYRIFMKVIDTGIVISSTIDIQRFFEMEIIDIYIVSAIKYDLLSWELQNITIKFEMIISVS